MTRWLLPIFLAVALVVTGVWGYNNYIHNRQYSILMDNIYQKSFYELVGHTGQIEIGLSKLMVSGDKGQHMVLLSDIWKQADAAQVNLAQLPITHLALEKTSKLLNQMSDYSYYLTKKVGQDKTLSTAEMVNLQSLHNNYAKLNNELRILEDNINRGGVKWGEVRAAGDKKMKGGTQNIVVKQFTKIEKTGIKYPSLIYDGPFSESLKQQKHVDIKGAAINQKKAEEIAADFLGRKRVDKITAGSSAKGDIETLGVYVYTKDEREPYFIAVSKKGGKVVLMTGNTANQKRNISIEKAKEMADKFLKSKGYNDMAPTYQQQSNGICVINYAYKKGDVIVYPDLIKVKISLDDGKIVGFESRNYLIRHKERDIKKPKLSAEEAKKLVSPNLQVTSGRLAIIPTESKGEKLCYEFKGKYGGENYIIYLDADTGEEVNILKIIDAQGGQMVI